MRIRIVSTYAFPMCIMLALLVALRPVGFDRDSVQYFLSSQAPSFDFRWIEPSFAFISFINGEFFLGGAFGLFFIYAALAIIIKYYSISLLTPYVKTSVFLYLSSFFLLLELTQIRFAVAAAFMLWSLNDLHLKSSKRFFLKVVFASFFHYSSLIYLSLYFIDKMKFNRLFWLFFPFLGLVVSFFLGGGLLSFILPDFLKVKVDHYMISSDKASVFSFYRIFTFFLYFFLLYLSSKISDTRFFLYMKIYAFSIFIFLSFLSFPSVFSVRFSGMFSLVIVLLIPYMFACFKDKFFVYVVIFLYSILNLFYLLFFVRIFDFSVVL